MANATHPRPAPQRSEIVRAIMALHAPEGFDPARIESALDLRDWADTDYDPSDIYEVEGRFRARLDHMRAPTDALAVEIVAEYFGVGVTRDGEQWVAIELVVGDAITHRGRRVCERERHPEPSTHERLVRGMLTEDELLQGYSGRAI